MNNTNTLPIGTVLNNGTYRIDEYLASGQFGNTYKVTEIRTGNIFAIKEFYLADDVVRQNDNTVTVTTSAKEALFEGQKNKFVKEAERLKSIHHKNIVRVIDYFPENNTWYYVMEYIDGKSLQQWLNGVPFVSEEKAMPVFMQLLEGLNYIHSLPDPLLHLDIKPSNIMVDKHGNTYLIDFGSSKHYDEDNGVKTRSVLTATNAYAPLELVKSRYNDLGPWTDLYSLGATLFKMLSNQSPSEVEDKGEAAFGKSSHISSPIKKLILWMMEYRWGNRPQSVKEVIDYLSKNHLNNNVKKNYAKNSLNDEKTIIVENNTLAKDDEGTIIESTRLGYGIISTKCQSGSAKVIIDNQYFGMTPIKTPVAVGAHNVYVSNGNESRTYNVYVNDGQTVEVLSCFVLNYGQSTVESHKNSRNKQQSTIVKTTKRTLYVICQFLEYILVITNTVVWELICILGIPIAIGGLIIYAFKLGDAPTVIVLLLLSIECIWLFMFVVSKKESWITRLFVYLPVKTQELFEKMLQALS